MGLSRSMQAANDTVRPHAIASAVIDTLSRYRYPFCMFGISGEHLLILGIVLLFFGPRRLPELGNTLGKAIRNFKDAISGVEEASFRKLPPEDQAKADQAKADLAKAAAAEHEKADADAHKPQA
jgi:sec-independent protein translocase protein TatA